MHATEDSLLLNGLWRSMISRVASGPGATMSAEGQSHSYGSTYEPNINRSSSLSLLGPTFASLVENDSLTAISDGASPTTPSALGGPPVGTPSSNDAQASLEASWESRQSTGGSFWGVHSNYCRALLSLFI